MGSTAVTVIPEQRLTVTEQQMQLVRRTVAKDATPDELALYLYDCTRQGVHPLDKLLHFTKRKGRYTPVTSIDLMRTRAADSGEYAGSDDAVFRGEPKKEGFEATVTVWRLVQGQRCPFTATARWSEYKPDAGESGNGDVMWRKMGHTMLAKCAEALALRKGFPRQLAGLYAQEEMAQSGNVPQPEDYDRAGDLKRPATPSSAPNPPQGQAKSPEQKPTAPAKAHPKFSGMDTANRILPLVKVMDAYNDILTLAGEAEAAKVPETYFVSRDGLAFTWEQVLAPSTEKAGEKFLLKLCEHALPLMQERIMALEAAAHEVDELQRPVSGGIRE